MSLINIGFHCRIRYVLQLYDDWEAYLGGWGLRSGLLDLDLELDSLDLLLLELYRFLPLLLFLESDLDLLRALSGDLDLLSESLDLFQCSKPEIISSLCLFSSISNKKCSNDKNLLISLQWNHNDDNFTEKFIFSQTNCQDQFAINSTTNDPLPTLTSVAGPVQRRSFQDYVG